MIFSYGYEGAATNAIREVMQDDVELRKLALKQQKCSLVAQNAAMQANAHAAQATADADANELRLTMNSQITQAAVTGANAGANIYSSRSLNQKLQPSTETTAHLEEFESHLNATKKPENIMGDAPDKNLPKLTATQEARLRDLKTGQGTLKYQKGDEVVLAHIKGKEADEKALTDRINQKKSDEITKRNEMTTRFQSTQQFLSMGFEASKQGSEAYWSSQKAINASDNKGPAQATQALAQTAGSQSQQMVESSSSAADTYAQQAAQLTRVLEALAEGQAIRG